MLEPHKMDYSKFKQGDLVELNVKGRGAIYRFADINDFPHKVRDGAFCIFKVINIPDLHMCNVVSQVDGKIYKFFSHWLRIITL